MSLNWSTQRVKYFNDNPDELWVKYCKDTPEEYEDVNAITKSLIFGSMAIGIGDITESNASDVYARWKIFEKYDDFSLGSQYNPETESYDKIFVSPEVILQHIGLSTNVSFETNAAWAKRYAKPMYNDKPHRPTIAQVKAMIVVLKMEFNDLVSEINNKTKETV